MRDDGPRTVLRPSVPPLAWLACGLWVGIGAAEASAWRVFMGQRPALVGWIVGAAFIAVVAVWRRGGLALLLALGVMAGALVGAMYWRDYGTTVRAMSATSDLRWIADTPEDPVMSEFGARSDVVVVSPTPGARLRCLWREDASAPELGERVTFRGSLKPPSRDEKGRRLHRTGVIGSVSPCGPDRREWGGPVGHIGRWRLGAVSLLARVPGVGGALLSGVVLGDRRRLMNTPAEDDFRITGLTHLVAISGGHLVVVAGVVAAVLAKLRARRGLAASIVLGVLGVYVVATGMQASAVRAWVMSAVVTFSLLGGRRGDPLAALATAVVLALVVDPTTAFDVGFQLSVSAVLGLLMFARLVDAWAGETVPQALAWLTSPIALTVTAQVATTPVAAATFGVVSLIAPVANVLVGPLITVVLFAGLAGLAVAPFSQDMAAYILMTGGAAGHLASDIAAWLAGVPGAAHAFEGAMIASIACGGLGVALWSWWPQPRRRIGRRLAVAMVLTVGAVLIGPPPPAGQRLVMLDVGQGDMLLLRDGDNAMVVDVGPSPRDAIDASARAGIRNCDAVVLTHLHADHAGGLEGLAGVVSARRLGVPAGADTNLDLVRSQGRVTELGAGQRWVLGDTEVRVVWPSERVSDAGTNESSVVLLVRNGDFSALLTGDAEDDVLTQLVSTGSVGDIDVLKVGHHGSADAVSEATLRTLRPEIALISVGEGNRYGHPVGSTVQLLERSGARIYRTDRDGDVTVEFGESGYRVKTQKHGARSSAYGTLVAARMLAHERMITPVTEGSHEQGHKSEAGLPDLRQRGVAAGTGAVAAQSIGGRGGGSRLQHGHLRRRERERGRHRSRIEYVSVRFRAPPRDRSQRRETRQGGPRDARQLCLEPVADDGAGPCRRQTRQEHETLQGRGQAWRCGRVCCAQEGRLSQRGSDPV